MGRNGNNNAFVEYDKITESPLLNGYYSQQLGLSSEEFEVMLETLKQPLPTTFRVSPFAPASFLKQMQSFSIPLTNFSWMQSAWQIDCSKTELKKEPIYKSFHGFLVNETDTGNVSRQELVSMIPPLFLDVQSHHLVLDMCAAPGSKTAQLIEQMHVSNSSPTGCIIANDVDYQRAKLLVHQSKRLNSPCVIVTNHAAQMFPSLKLSSGDNQQTVLLFDRILCDVPCSGDGTLRKNPNIWKSFSPHNGNSLHPLQLAILTRAVGLLSNKGRIVYSTCSFNPIENEAVVASVIRASNGTLRIVECGEMLPELKRVAGLKRWIVQNKEGVVVESPRDKIVESMFAVEGEDLGLEKCMRFYPHHMNTGGFFVAVIERVQNEEESRKRKADVSESTSKAAKTEDADEVSVEESVETQPQEKSLNSRPYKNQKQGQDPEFSPLPVTSIVSTSIAAYYALSPDFPMQHLFTRSTSADGYKLIYYTSAVASKLLTHKSLKIINAGVQLFKRNEAKCSNCDFRITNDGVDTIAPHLGARVFTLTSEEMLPLLVNPYTGFKELMEGARAFCEGEIEGCVLFRFIIGSGDDGEERVVPVWRGKGSVNVLVGKAEKAAMYMRICGKEIAPAIEKCKKDKAAE